MGKKVPDRWLNYKCHGRAIKDTRIIAFKVPLKYETCRQLLPSDQFTPEMLMKLFPNLKYIIDLTATTRYYRRTEFTSSGVAHVKVEVPGQQVPKHRHSLKFFDAMDTFMSVAKDNELIGVHCTHGLNRTGFMICQYLIRQLGWDVSAAIKEFEDARGHPMEREPYLRELALTPRGDKLRTRIDITIIDCKNDQKEANDKCERPSKFTNCQRIQEESTDWRDHPSPPLPAPPPTSFNYHSGLSHSREYPKVHRDYSHNKMKSVNNSKELMKPSLSARTSQHNTHKHHSQTQQYSWRADKRRTIVMEDGNVTANIAEKIRKLENTFPNVQNKYSLYHNRNDFTADSYDSNLTTAHTVPIPQTSRRKHRNRFY